MSTTEAAVAEKTTPHRSYKERAVTLGPGIIRLSDTSFLRPESASIEVKCLGPLAYWVVSATFQLPDPEPGALFLFPLPNEASLQAVRLGEEELMPGRLSVEAIESLPEESEVPLPDEELVSLFSQENNAVFSLRLDSLESLEGEVVIVLEYASGLPTVDGRIQLLCPTGVSPFLEAAGETSLSITVSIEDGTELVDDPESELEFLTEQEGELTVLRAELDSPTSDLAVTFRPGRTQMPVTRLRRSEEHFIFSIFPPTSIPASPQRRDLVFALDASENFEPALFEQVKQDLANSLRNLDENDRFALVTFGREIDGYDGGEFCEIDKVEAACQWLEEAKPIGRADVQPLLTRIQSLPSQEDRQLCIFLLAAGHVGNEPAILKSLDFDQSDRRYYTVGIGPTVQQSFLRRLALLTRGRCEVAGQDGCGEALTRLLGQTRALLAEVTFEELDGDSGVDSESLVPSRMTSLTPEGPVHCLGAGSPSSLRFRSKDETGVFFAGTVNAQATDNPALGGVWAGLKVREMLDSVNLTTGARKKALMTEASALAAEHGVLTEDTILVLKLDDDETVLQYSVLPAVWRGVEPKVKKSSVSNKDGGAPFDWRKGLVAREGLFKGSKTPSGDSGESAGRYGLRSKGASSNETSGKPRLDRAVSVTASHLGEEEMADFEDGEEILESLPSAEVDQSESAEPLAELSPVEDSLDSELPEPAPVNSRLEPSKDESADPPDSTEDSLSEELPPAEPIPAAELPVDVAPSSSEPEPAPAPPNQVASAPAPVSAPAPAPPSPATSTVPVAVGQPQPPVVHLHTDPLAESRARLESYRSQLGQYDAELALAALQGLPPGVSPSGGELPRILAQTVAHLEKRGYFSHAVAVLGLLMKESPSTEVTKKMESLLIGWTESLPEEKLPEAIQILQLGQRVCREPGELAQRCEAVFERWTALAGEQSALPERAALAEVPALDSLLSQPQMELSRLKQEQAALAKQMVELKDSLEEKLAALPALLDLNEWKNSMESRLAALPDQLFQVIAQAAPAAPPPSAPAASATVVSAPPPSQTSPAPIVDLSEPSTPVPDQVVPLESVSTLETSLPSATELSDLTPAAAPLEEPAAAPLEEAVVLPHPDELDPDPDPDGQDPSVEESFEIPMPSFDPPSVEVEHTVEVIPPESEQPEVPEESGEEMVLTKEELLEMLLADPKSDDSRRAVAASLKEAKDRINFFRDLVKADASEPYHSLSLARAYRDADQTKVAVVHYQKYLRSEKDAEAYAELADAYDELGKANLSASARKAAEAYASS